MKSWVSIRRCTVTIVQLLKRLTNSPTIFQNSQEDSSAFCPDHLFEFQTRPKKLLPIPVSCSVHPGSARLRIWWTSDRCPTPSMYSRRSRCRFGCRPRRQGPVAERLCLQTPTADGPGSDDRSDAPDPPLPCSPSRSTPRPLLPRRAAHLQVQEVWCQFTLASG